MFLYRKGGKRKRGPARCLGRVLGVVINGGMEVLEFNVVSLSRPKCLGGEGEFFASRVPK